MSTLKIVFKEHFNYLTLLKKNQKRYIYLLLTFE